MLYTGQISRLETASWNSISTFRIMKVFVVISVVLALALAESPAYRQQRRYYFARQEEETTPYTPTDAPYAPSGWKPAGPTFDLPQKQQGNSYIPPRAVAGASDSNIQQQQQQYGAPDAAQPQESRDQAQRQQQQQQQQQQQLRFANSQFQARFQQQQQQRQQQIQQQQQFAGSQTQQQQRPYFAPVFQPQTNQYGVPEPQEQFQPPRPDQEYGAPLTTTEEPAVTTTEIEDATTTAAPQPSDSEVEPVNSVNELDEEGNLDEQQASAEQQRGEYYIALPDGRLQRIQYVSSQDLEAMKYFARIRAENVEPLRGPIYSYSPLREVQFAPSSLNLAPVSSFPSSAAAAAAAAPAAPAPVAAPAKYELQEEAAASPPLAALVQYSYGAPSAVIPLNDPSRYSANYKAPESRYLLSF